MADLFIANGHVRIYGDPNVAGATYKERKQLFHNAGNGAFTEIADPAQLGDLGCRRCRASGGGRLRQRWPSRCAWSQSERPGQLFHNNDKSGHHWVRFKTIGVKSNRDGLHARFTLTAGGVKQVASVRAGSSYLSASDRRVYFGLGTATEVDKVEIRWPSGTRDVLPNLLPNASYIVTEGRGVTGRQPTAEQIGTRRTTVAK